MPKANNILVICGPTASGKTGLSLAIARKLPSCNILSVDSIQLFKGLDIVSGKDIPSDLPDSIKFFGINILKEDDSFNLSEFIEYGRNIIRSSLSSGTPLIIVGGTGFYLQGLLTEKIDIAIPPNQKLREELELKSKEDLQQLLSETNPDKFRTLNNSDVNNPRRLIRAIEISLSPKDSGSNHKRTTLPELTVKWVGIKNGKEESESSIKSRVVERLKAGAVDDGDIPALP